MRSILKLSFLFVFIFISNLSAEEKEAIAVVEFKNRSEGAVRFNGTDLAAWMSNDLKKRERFNPVNRKAVAKIVKDAEWADGRLDVNSEAKLREIPAKYALYSSLVRWSSSVDSSTTGTGISPRMKTKDVLPGVLVLYHFELVDLKTGKTVKTFETEGSGLAETRGGSDSSGLSPEQRQFLTNELANFDNSFEEANRLAIQKAAFILSKEEE